MKWGVFGALNGALVFGFLHLQIFGAPDGPTMSRTLALGAMVGGITGGFLAYWLNKRA